MKLPKSSKLPANALVPFTCGLLCITGLQLSEILLYSRVNTICWKIFARRLSLDF